jgi:methylenetetrahydrofolate dehydrogenase (NADP+)/methenyltetrahydrofolate cyclohydrolase
MAATLIDGKAIAAQIKDEVRRRAAVLKNSRGITPGLAVVLVGDDPASQSYVRSKGKACEALGFHSVTERLPADTPEGDLLGLIANFNADRSIHGILVQLPLPPHIHEQRIIEAVDYRKDVDGLHPVNVGRLVLGMSCLRPCTPAGVQELLMRSGYDPSGKHVVVAGRSNIVGKPVANMLYQKKSGANAVVTIVHTGAGDLAYYTRQADIIVAAMGRPRAITGAMVKPGAVVIDVGINRVDAPGVASGYILVGDVDEASVRPVASALTPVPGGVGPMTIAMLMHNTLIAAEGELYLH